MRRQVLLLLFSLFAIVGFAQQRTVTGTVVSAEDGLPVIGAINPCQRLLTRSDNRLRWEIFY